MPVVGTKGAMSSQGFGEFAQASGPANYIEDVFSTYLYTGNGSTQTITNGIDLAGNGGMVWTKSRSIARSNGIIDTTRGISKWMSTNSSTAEATYSTTITSVSSTGFTVGTDIDYNESGTTYASWTFRKQPNFFDVVTYTGTGANRTIAHNLGSVPGCIIVKRTNSGGNWQVYHRNLTSAANSIQLNLTSAQAAAATVWNSTAPTSTVFSVGTDITVNASGGTYVAYIFAHDAGGFGLTGTDNVISCGSFTTNSASNATVNLGYEAQWVLTKRVDSTSDWRLFDVMRGMSQTEKRVLYPNASNAEETGTHQAIPTATGFTYFSGGIGVSTFIYIAIRRGPMKVPTSGTSVFGLNARTGTGVNATVTGSAGVSDAVLIKNRGAAVASLFSSRLTGTGYLVTSTTAAEVAAGATILQANPWDVMDGVKVGTTSTITNASANTYINYLFDRAPGFFDVVCYTGTGSYPLTINHNLGVVPELMIFKTRSSTDSWWVYAKPVTSPQANWYQNYASLNSSSNFYSDTTSFTTSPTSTTITFNSFFSNSGVNYVAYLFASCPGVSKVGSYTGTGATQTISCGFTGGARFVLIKRTDSTGDWYVWDTARGMVSGTDPSLLLNSTAVEVNANSIYTTTGGFQIVSTAAGINASGGSYIFLAIS